MLLSLLFYKECCLFKSKLGECRESAAFSMCSCYLYFFKVLCKQLCCTSQMSKEEIAWLPWLIVVGLLWLSVFVLEKHLKVIWRDECFLMLDVLHVSKSLVCAPVTLTCQFSSLLSSPSSVLSVSITSSLCLTKLKNRCALHSRPSNCRHFKEEFLQSSSCN